MAQIARVLLSVTDKTGIVEFASALAAMGAELISTGGTARLLREAGIPVADVSDVTGTVTVDGNQQYVIGDRPTTQYVSAKSGEIIVLDSGGLVVDIRPEAQRRVEGELPGAVVIERNVLAPSSDALTPTMPGRRRSSPPCGPTRSFRTAATSRPGW